jgi:uncharacterized membrane protein (DUF2068 family)
MTAGVGPLEPAPRAVTDTAGQRATLRVIATFEAVKGVIALAAGFGLLSLLHHDLHHVAASLIGHLGLDPGQRYPALLLHYADLVQDADRRSLVLLCVGYVTLRLAEAYGLWQDTRWGMWLGAASGALYVPFELRHIAHHATVAGVAVLVFNVVIVVVLLRQVLRDSRRAAATRAGAAEP